MQTVTFSSLISCAFWKQTAVIEIFQYLTILLRLQFPIFVPCQHAWHAERDIVYQSVRHVVVLYLNECTSRQTFGPSARGVTLVFSAPAPRVLHCQIW